MHKTKVIKHPSRLDMFQNSPPHSLNIQHNFSGAKRSPEMLCIWSQCSNIVSQNAAVSTGAWPGWNETLCRKRQKMPLIP